MSKETVAEELSFQEQAEQLVLFLLEKSGEPISPEKLVTSVAKKLNCQYPSDKVRRAVWSLLADGRLEFTSQNEIVLGK